MGVSASPMPQGMTMPEPKRGSQIGNRNSLKHGLTSGRLPPGSSYIKRAMGRFVAAVEEAVVDAGGELDVMTAATIQSAMRWERHALLAQRWLVQAFGELSHADRLAYSREIARASSERDKCLRVLGIGPDEIGGPVYNMPVAATPASPDVVAQETMP